MTTELYIENYRLDISNDISTLLTFGLDDLKDFSSRSTTFSKTIVLPGTANNNKLFGHIFQPGQNNQYVSTDSNVGYNFNASKSADCIIFQDQLQTFTGVLRLMQINTMQGRIEYEVAVFGKLSGLNVALSSNLLETLDFSTYDDVYNETNIIASWDNPGGSGVYYPLIDYGQYSIAKADWDIRTFRPALYVKEYIDKMFASAGFRYSSALFETARFKSFVVPHNQKALTKIGTSLALATATTPYDYFVDNSGPGVGVAYDDITATGFILTSTPGSNVQYTAAPTVTVNLDFNMVVANVDDGSFPVTFDLSIYTPGQTILASQTIPAGSFFPQLIHLTAAGVVLHTNDIIAVNTTSISSTISVNFGGSVTSLLVSSLASTIINVNPGDTVSINSTIPKNIRQIDFLVSIVKLFNLYVYEDRFDPSLIYITPYIDFYTTDSADAINWTYKLNRDKATQVKPMSEINAKKYLFNYKSDSDYYNDLYRKRYGTGYGDYIFDSLYEFAEQTKSFELVFSATPLVGYAGEDKVMSTIFKQSNGIEEQVDSNIRILQSKKIIGVTSWDILDAGSPLTSTTNYGYAGHFDDPDAPSNDLNFGALAELFFILASGNLSNTQFNVYWSSYMAEITDKDSKLFSGSFYLTTKDIFDLDFSKFIYMDGVLFRLSKITDYNMTTVDECKVDLLKVNFLIY